ncbi:MAG: DsbA family protein [Candidatus Woesearchaeota archaeon]
MICIAALIVFGILGLFSAKYRKIAKEALDCVFRRITLRPCTTGLDKRLRAELSGKLMRKNSAAGRFVYKYFEVFSWLFLILFVASIVGIAVGGYNYAVYGDCNGPSGNGFCPFNPGVGSVSSISTPDEVTVVVPVEGNPRKQYGTETPKLVLVEFGCFTCHNTEKMVSVLDDILKKHPDVALEFRTFPIRTHPLADQSALAAECAFQQDMFWPYYDVLFERQANITSQNLVKWALEIKLDMTLFEECIKGNESKNAVSTDLTIGQEAGIYGTPTIFINDQILVGVQPFKKIDKLVQDALKN